MFTGAWHLAHLRRAAYFALHALPRSNTLR
jgi:hypothetical protein